MGKGLKVKVIKYLGTTTIHLAVARAWHFRPTSAMLVVREVGRPHIIEIKQ